MRYTYGDEEYNSKDSSHGNKQTAAKERNETGFLRPRHSSLPKHGHGDHDKVKVCDEVERKTCPYQTGWNGSVAEGTRVWEDLPPLAERAAAEKQIHLDNHERCNDQAKADHDTGSISFKVLC
jgi:hypothetical protein